VQIEQLESPAHLLRFDTLDEEVAYEGEQIATEPSGQTHPRRLLPFVCLLACVAVCGIVSALIWRNLDSDLLSSTAQSLQRFTAHLTPAQSSTGISSEQVLKIEALKTEISELRTEHEQLVASIVSSRARQQELQRFSSNKVTYWYSEPTALLYHIAGTQP
jgi:hypothetical protein